MDWHTNLNGVDFSTYDTFKRSVEGQGWDLDGYWGAQCWDGSNMIYQHVGMRLRTASYYGGDAYVYTCWTWEACRNYNGSGYFSLVADKTQLKKGDVIIWSDQVATGFTGHTGYANEDYNGTNSISTLSQNWRNPSEVRGSAFSVDNISLNAFLGAFRYSGWNGTKPPDPPDPPEPPKPDFPSLRGTSGKFPWVLYARKLRERR